MQGAGSDRTGIIRGQDAGKPPLPDAFSKAPHVKYARILDVLATMMPACMEHLHTSPDGSATGRSPLPSPVDKAPEAAPSAAGQAAQEAEALPSILSDVDAVDTCARLPPHLPCPLGPPPRCGLLPYPQGRATSRARAGCVDPCCRRPERAHCTRQQAWHCI